MKKSIQLAAAALIGASFSAGAWWGPYGGTPYWGGYAPAYGSAPWGAGPVQTAPFSAEPGDFADDPFMPPMHRQMFKQSDAERKQWQAASEARREAAKTRAAAQRAASEARRKAWRNSVRSYSPYSYGAPFGYPMPIAVPTSAAAEEVPMERPATTPTEAAPAPQPASVAEAAAPQPAAVPTATAAPAAPTPEAQPMHIYRTPTQ